MDDIKVGEYFWSGGVDARIYRVRNVHDVRPGDFVEGIDVDGESFAPSVGYATLHRCVDQAAAAAEFAVNKQPSAEDRWRAAQDAKREQAR